MISCPKCLAKQKKTSRWSYVISVTIRNSRKKLCTWLPKLIYKVHKIIMKMEMAGFPGITDNFLRRILCIVDRASLYNFVNKANLVYNFSLVYLFLVRVYLSICTCFGRLCALHQEKQLCLCDTLHMLFYVDDCLVCSVEWNCFIPPCIPDSHPHRMTLWYAGWSEKFHSTLHTRQSSTQNNKYQVSHKHRCFSWWRAHSRLKHVEIDKYTKNKCTKNKLCTNLALFTRFLRGYALYWYKRS